MSEMLSIRIHTIFFYFMINYRKGSDFLQRKKVCIDDIHFCDKNIFLTDTFLFCSGVKI